MIDLLRLEKVWRRSRTGTSDGFLIYQELEAGFGAEAVTIMALVRS